MRRAVITLVSTAAGLAAVLTYKTHSAASVDAAGTPASAPSAAVSAAPPAGGAAAGATAGGGTAASAGKTRTVTGVVANTARGPMQVQLTLSGTKITKAAVLQQTDDGPESAEIDSFAIPKLESETLAAQSAKIDAVSGASYTSAGYIQSLQSAVDQARG